MRPTELLSISLKISIKACRLFERIVISSGLSNHNFIGAAPFLVIVITTYLNVSYVHPEHKSAKQSGTH
jgi:hypothetical protein